MKTLIQQRERRQAVWKIDTWLTQRHSPMIGCGEYYIQNQERTGIPATLSVGIAEAESSNGMQTYNPPTWYENGVLQYPPAETYNAWGMIGREYYRGFGSWEDGIRANFDYLVRWFGCPQTMHNCPGYCEGNTTMRTVDWVQATINGFDASQVP